MVDSGQIPHAILLEGPEGIGKHALARAFLQYVGCTSRRDGDSCGVCPACRQHQSMQHIDTIYSFPYVRRDSSSKDTLANDWMVEFIEYALEYPFMDESVWRQRMNATANTKPVMYVSEANELIKRLSYAPRSSQYNSLIMWQADRLNEEAANKLLKMIEEPPGQSIIVMTSNMPMNILPTIYSRTQRIRVNRLSDNEVAQWIADNTEVTAEHAADIAPLAGGRIAEARKIASRDDDSSLFFDNFVSLMRLAYMRDIASLKNWSQKLGAEKRETIVDFLEYTARMLRENFVANLHDASLNIMSSTEKDFSRNFARFINEKNVSDLFEATSQAINDVRANVNPKIVLFDYAITVILKLKG